MTEPLATSTGDIAVRDLVCTFGGVHAVDGASFVASSGKLTGLVGPNGAGKSTVLNCIAGSLKPAAGTICFGSNDITGLFPYQVGRLGIVRTFQISSEFARMTVMENLLVAARERSRPTLLQAVGPSKKWRTQEEQQLLRAREVLNRFGLSRHESHYAGELSGGQKRLVEIMRALMASPSALLLDEPLAGVNPTLAKGVESALADIRDSGITTIMVEHELGAVERLSDDVVVMAEGRVIAHGSMDDVRQSDEVVDAYIGR